METLKQAIKELATKQVELKNQRRTVRLVGERTMSSDMAAYKHFTNRDLLRHMYMAYGIMRGLHQEQIESNPKTPVSMTYVSKLIEKYTPKEVSV